MSTPELIAPERIEELLAGALPDTDTEAALQGVALELRSGTPAAGEELRTRVRALSSARRHWRGRVPRRRVALGVAALAIVSASLVVGDLGFRGLGSPDSRATERGVPHGSNLTGKKQVNGGGAALLPLTRPSISSRLRPSLAPAGLNARAQHVNMWIELRVRDADRLSSAANEAMRITRELGGFVATSTVGTRANEGRAELALRVPVGKVDDALFRLSQLGAITSQRVVTEDRQAAIDSSLRRIVGLRSAIRIAQLRLGSGTLSPKERLEIQIKLERLRRQLASVQRSNAGLVHEAATAELTLVLHTGTPGSGQVDKNGLGGIVADAFHLLGRAGAVALFMAIVLTPLVLLALLVWLLRRRYLRHHEVELLDRTRPGAPSPQPPGP